MKRATRKSKSAARSAARPEPTGQSGSAGRLMDKRRRHLALWLAVGGTFALIFTLWLLLLPSQFGRQGLRELSRWTVLQETTDQPIASFKENLERLNRQFNDLIGQDLNQSGATGEKFDVAKLRAKFLESGLIKGETPPADGSAVPNQPETN